MLNARQIEAFRAVMISGSMTAAADAICVTQPAVSRLIRDLEAELGFVLFYRRGNAVIPTPQAAALLGEVELSYVGLERIRAFAEGLRTGDGGSLRVAGLPAMAAGFLPRFVARFSRTWPALKIHVDGLSSTVIRAQVASGQLDIGFAAYPFTNSALVITSLEDGAVVALPPGHALASRPVVRIQDMDGQRLILLQRFTTGLHPDHIALQAVAGRSPIETPLASMACQLVVDGAGIAVVDRFSACEFLDKGLILRPFELATIFGSAVIHARERPLSPAADRFRTAFLEHARAFLQDGATAAP